MWKRQSGNGSNAFEFGLWPEMNASIFVICRMKKTTFSVFGAVSISSILYMSCPKPLRQRFLSSNDRFSMKYLDNRVFAFCYVEIMPAEQNEPKILNMCFILESFVVHSTFFTAFRKVLYIWFALLALFLFTLTFIGWIKTICCQSKFFVFFVVWWKDEYKKKTNTRTE